MINLFDQDNQASRDLGRSLEAAGFDWPTVVLTDDGFLDDHLASPFQFFMGEEDASCRALYFNELPVPAYWEIMGDNSSARVEDLGQVKARIYYAEPKHKRLINKVDWLDEKGRVAFVDIYNQYGRRFSRIAFDTEERMSIKTYYDTQGREALVHNLVTDTLSLNYQGQTYFFRDQVDFICFYLKEAGFDLSGMLINSLAMPFLVSHRLALPGEDILFWQEPIHDTIPGNMQMIFAGTTPRARTVIVDDKTNYQRLQGLLAEQEAGTSDQLKHLGYIYPIEEPVRNTNEALVLTNSDQVESLEELLQALPDWHFHVGALTEMSDKLMGLDHFSNLTLYPNISQDKVEDLLKRCKVYLDINYANEILNAVRRAFDHRQLILAFRETLHQDRYTAAEHRFNKANVEGLIAHLDQVGLDETLWIRGIEVQLAHVGQTRVEDYRDVLAGGCHDK
ncbi:accessory Sec system glycosylation chaperone GtfB [Aerococcus sp. UMB10185]|uniref:accessory Sec system glycosylation chaperone GtfB n=1 Tax=unclassified Aerococcus TaxID=2618060 RepID=UPI0008A25E5D|nr:MULTISPECIES: accessory Sec system glycosylation chaperone GtfB [unclassified Aerococcus]MDK6233997.1 accessory Sec system glycosylation chaperone GtfB [Aerococcus sp. UMB10185]MDK6856533.1 accessory Sec system glycosylation chaperone GtfB [Aerococcus sp. UMB7533]OFN03424.1 hypothetical protein HMPREF2626_05995 [Aerococcus sp. HMSC062A02]OHO45746.1 hypothetical protein HMPREF2705_04100 [Aerococcus sp. HMSC035B07]